MIWQLLYLLNNPDQAAITIKDGEIWLEDVDLIKAAGGRIRG